MNLRNVIALIIFGLSVCTANAAGDDVSGAVDPEPIGARFPTAVITAQDTNEFDAFTLITGPVEKEGEIGSSQYLEGRVTTTVYEIPADRSTLEVFRNYENKLSEFGGETLYSCMDAVCGGRAFNLTVVPYSKGFGGNENGQRYLAARTKTSDGVSYLSLYVTKNYSVGGDTKDRVYVRLVVVDVEEMATELVVVDADEMQRQIADSGHVALYGIQFAFDSAEILAESRSALTEIAKLMAANPELEILVVGHTDNVGSHDYNMNLSDRRAGAVRRSLIDDYGIAGARLAAYGAGFLAPTASNVSEEGRALNRRVELVQR